MPLVSFASLNTKVSTCNTNNVILAEGTNNIGKVNVMGSNGSGNYFPGQIGPLLLYDRELSSTEVTQVYDAYKSRFGY